MASPRLFDPVGLAEKLTIVIPAYNEQAGIVAALDSLSHEPRLRGAEILVIDDGSTDGTAQSAREHAADVLRNRTNCGYGASLKRGVRAARTEYVAWFDADGQHRAHDLAEMLHVIADERADAVIDARTADSHVARGRSLGKRIIHRAAEAAVARRIPDVNCGLRVFRRETLARYLHLLPDGFSASTTSTLVLIQRKYDVLFHPVQVAPRIGQSTVNQFRDGLRALHTILRILVLFNALRTFGVAAAAFVLTGLLYGMTVALLHGLGFPVLGALLVTLGIQVFCLGVVCDQISALRLERLERSVSAAADGAAAADKDGAQHAPQRRVA